MIDFKIVDTHLHVWNPRKIDYPWLADIPFLNKPFLIGDYRKDCKEVEIEKMVIVQAEAAFSLYKEEVEWVTSLTEEDDRISGIVAWAPLEKGVSVEPEIAHLSRNPLVKGIRRIIQFETDPEFCLDESFMNGVRLLPKYGLTFDICINHTQMANTIKLVEQCPDVNFILDHIGKPDIKNHLLDPWKEELKTLSGFQNTWCKVSGLVTEADHKNWAKDDLKPYLDHVFECFGFDRTMYGGDWPVATQATEYPRWVKTLEWAVAGCNIEELEKLFRENAIQFYRLANGNTNG